MQKCLVGISLLLIFSCNQIQQSNSVDYSTEKIMEAIPFAKGIISSEANSEFSLMFSPNGRKVYFSRRAPEEKQKIYETEFQNDKWTEPIQSAFSTDRDEAP